MRIILAFLTAGTAGATGTTCTAFTGGICTTATEPEMTMEEMIAEIRSLRQEVQTLRASMGVR